ncbi:hypothetical protein GMA11_05655 [Granulicatella sp. zg-ZJ]|uniref:cell wall elongation regulator TseB-like domain-containing protein n=1 Tax=unclassified Granulicatella TaxID=2630493 RepID=UPI0013C17BE7|nr:MULTISPECIES: DUF5590 domain-containing protein [unclassified Granulicatella]MBS4750613.1 DUF5590 domain-containing protein [Carnobacteriaceae bacterium zg-ZUI78]NEW62874.1 hypothetical protein [Granulicatella sp. zg-ZJ]NEW66319.1 hypothetical protein [Granulicatella sp. zg-84]QMI85384.1 DUF5590 domain-containing protein [Carnobacteriaceae bacterium zg-84]
MKKILIGVSIVFVVGLILTVSTIETLLSPYNKAKQEAAQLVFNDGIMKKIDDFYLYQFDKTVYGLYGDSQDNKKIYVVIDVESSQAQIYETSELIDKDKAKEVAMNEENTIQILNVTLGLMKNEPIWEVSYKSSQVSLGYMRISAKTGQIIQHIKTI